jgi:hypothetical protein
MAPAATDQHRQAQVIAPGVEVRIDTNDPRRQKIRLGQSLEENVARRVGKYFGRMHDSSAAARTLGFQLDEHRVDVWSALGNRILDPGVQERRAVRHAARESTEVDLTSNLGPFAGQPVEKVPVGGPMTRLRDDENPGRGHAPPAVLGTVGVPVPQRQVPSAPRAPAVGPRESLQWFDEHAPNQ